MRDFAYPHETMPTESDAEFVAMVRRATQTGHWSSEWMPRLIELAERGAQSPKKALRFWSFMPR